MVVVMAMVAMMVGVVVDVCWTVGLCSGDGGGGVVMVGVVADACLDRQRVL